MQRVIVLPVGDISNAAAEAAASLVAGTLRHRELMLTRLHRTA